MLYGDLPAEERPNLLPAFWSPDYNDAWNHLWPQVSCQAWQAGNGGHYCNERVESLLEQTRTPAMKRCTDPPWARSSRSSPETIPRRSTTPSPNGSPCCAMTSAGSRPIWSSVIWSTSMPCTPPGAEALEFVMRVPAERQTATVFGFAHARLEQI